VGGGTPVTIDGQVAGAVGVSGATEDQDQQIASIAAAAIAS
jgi:glc operon protein GlcG